MSGILISESRLRSNAIFISQIMSLPSIWFMLHVFPSVRVEVFVSIGSGYVCYQGSDVQCATEKWNTSIVYLNWMLIFIICYFRKMRRDTHWMFDDLNIQDIQLYGQKF